MENQPDPKSILLVEDEYLIADVVREALAMQDWHVVGPFSNVTTALAALDGGAEIDAAVLDVNLNGEFVFPLVDRLMQQRTPVILTTGYAVDDIPRPYGELPRLSKPVSLQELIDRINQLLAAGESGELQVQRIAM